MCPTKFATYLFATIRAEDVTILASEVTSADPKTNACRVCRPDGQYFPRLLFRPEERPGDKSNRRPRLYTQRPAGAPSACSAGAGAECSSNMREKQLPQNGVSRGGLAHTVMKLVDLQAAEDH